MPDPSAPSARPAARHRTLATLTLCAAGVLALVGALAAAIGILNALVYNPTALVRTYLTALERADADAALALPGVSDGTPPTASRELLRSDTITAPDDIESIRERATPSGAAVTVRYRYGERVTETTFHLEQRGAVLAVFPRWRFAQSPLTVLHVTVEHAHTFTLGAHTLDARAASDEPGAATSDAFTVNGDYLVFTPGSYTLEHEGRMLEAAPQQVIVRGGAPAHATVTVRPTPAFDEAVQRRLDALLATCTEQAVLEPTGCPFGTRIENRVVGEPSWTITRTPQVDVIAGDGGWRGTTTMGVATIRATVKSIYDGSVSHLDDDVSFGVDVSRITLEPDGAVHVTIDAG